MKTKYEERFSCSHPKVIRGQKLNKKLAFPVSALFLCRVFKRLGGGQTLSLSSWLPLSHSAPTHVVCQRGVGPHLCPPLPLSKGPLPSYSRPWCRFQVEAHPFRGLFLEPRNFSAIQPHSPCSAVRTAREELVLCLASGTRT